MMPADKVRYYNKIDMGIFLFVLETCLEHENHTFERILFADTTDDSAERTLIAVYALSGKESTVFYFPFLLPSGSEKNRRKERNGLPFS